MGFTKKNRLDFPDVSAICAAFLRGNLFQNKKNPFVSHIAT